MPIWLLVDPLNLRLFEINCHNARFNDISNIQSCSIISKFQVLKNIHPSQNYPNLFHGILKNIVQ